MPNDVFEKQNFSLSVNIKIFLSVINKYLRLFLKVIEIYTEFTKSIDGKNLHILNI